MIFSELNNNCLFPFPWFLAKHIHNRLFPFPWFSVKHPYGPENAHKKPMNYDIPDSLTPKKQLYTFRLFMFTGKYYFMENLYLNMTYYVLLHFILYYSLSHIMLLSLFLIFVISFLYNFDFCSIYDLLTIDHYHHHHYHHYY